MSPHPEFSLQKGDCTSQTCMSAMNNRHAIEQYFAVLKECMEKYDLWKRQAGSIILMKLGYL